jgi:hypothetical protein
MVARLPQQTTSLSTQQQQISRPFTIFTTCLNSQPLTAGLLLEIFYRFMRLSLFGANNANECIMAVASLAIVSGFWQGYESTGNSQQTRKLNLRQAQLRSKVFEALHVVSGFVFF